MRHMRLKALGRIIEVQVANGLPVYYNSFGRKIFDPSIDDIDDIRAALFLHGTKRFKQRRPK